MKDCVRLISKYKVKNQTCQVQNSFQKFDKTGENGYVEVPEQEEPEKILLLLLFLLCFVKFIMEEFEYVIVEEKNLGKQTNKKECEDKDK